VVDKSFATMLACLFFSLQEFPTRHGNLPGLVDVFTLRINDNLIDLTGPNSIIGKSIVVHGANLTRLACGESFHSTSLLDYCDSEHSFIFRSGNIEPWTPGAKA
jgi:hypothetical protein